MNVALTPSFEKSLRGLTNREQAAVKQVPTDFMMNSESPGHRLHKLKCREHRFASISVNMDLRIIVLKDGAQLLFCYVGHHDDAYRWAERRRLEVHPTTGAAQMVELEEVIREEISYVTRELETPPLFAEEDDDYLLSLGVPRSWLVTIKKLDEDGLCQIVDRLPEEAQEALFAIVAGERPEPAVRRAPDEDPFSHPDARRRFWVAADERALRQALDYPWEQWMVFLHPNQRAAVERNFGGPARVSGGAGTGKTVVAMHRAVHLAQQSENAKILLTTYSRPLVRHLEQGLDRLAGSSGDVRRRIRIAHLHRLAYEIAQQCPGLTFAPVRPADLKRYFELATADHPEVKVTPEFLRAEFDAVIDYWGIKDWMAYRDVQRTGRGSSLSPAHRKRLWPVFESVLGQMRQAGKMTWSDLAETARNALMAREENPFDYVVADEAQDFGPRELDFLMALAPVSAKSHLFAGDVGQRIYRYPFSWLRAGIDIRGRAARLTINYRTTRQIKSFADAALGSLEPGDDEEETDRSSISLLSGPEPIVSGYESAEDETAALAEWLKALTAEGFEPREIGLFARTVDVLESRGAAAVQRAELNAAVLGDRDEVSTKDCIALGTLHAAKGLEFRAVGLLGCNDELVPHPSALAAADNAESKAVALARERQLFYVGCTRARDILRITYAGEPSPFLMSPR